MQKSHSKKSNWSYAQDTSNGDSVQWHNSVLQSQTAYGGQNLIFTLINLILNKAIKTGSSYGLKFQNTSFLQLWCE
jgi:phospholipase/lecithinase/hemolysin